MDEAELTDAGFARRVDIELDALGYPENNILRRKAVQILTRADAHQAEIDALTARLTAMTENAERLAEYVMTAEDYARDVASGRMWTLETTGDGGQALISLSTDLGDYDLDNFRTALAAHRKLIEQQT